MVRTDGILFDLDGTLWDSSAQVAQSWNETLKRFPTVNKVINRQDIQGIMGLLQDEIASALFPELSEGQRAEVTQACLEEEIPFIRRHGGGLYNGVEDTLAFLSSRFPLYLVSNCEKGYLEGFLEYHKLGSYFTDFESAGNTGLSKKDNIALVVRRNGRKAPVYVGDTAGDHRAACAAHVPFIFAGYGFGKVEGTPKISKISELKEMCLPLEK